MGQSQSGSAARGEKVGDSDVRFTNHIGLNNVFIHGAKASNPWMYFVASALAFEVVNDISSWIKQTYSEGSQAHAN